MWIDWLLSVYSKNKLVSIKKHPARNMSYLWSSSSLSTFFLFWPFPGAELTSLAIWAMRIFLKSSCVRRRLVLTTAALALRSSSGILCNFSAWHIQTTKQVQMHNFPSLESSVESDKKVVWSSPLLPDLHQRSDAHSPTLHLHHPHSCWHSPSRLEGKALQWNKCFTHILLNKIISKC